MANATIKVTMERERDTKNTVRFAEADVPDESDVRIGTIYVPKVALGDLGNPDRIEVTIAAA